MPTTFGYRLTICILQMTRLAQIGCNGATGHKLNTTLSEGSFALFLQIVVEEYKL